MKRFFLVAVSLFLVTHAPLQAADFGFGIPDMVGEKVDELDEKVREFKANQPFFEEFRSATVVVSNDTRDQVVSSVVTGNSLNNRIFVALDINRPDSEGIVLFQADGEGKPVASQSLSEANEVGEPSFEQLTISPTDQFVDILLNIPTDSGPQGVFFRRQADNRFSSVGGFGGAGTGEIVIGSTAQSPGQVDTAAEVNTFSYDDVEGDIYFSGDSGVFKVLSFPEDGGFITPSDWGDKFQGKFSVPRDNLVLQGDTVFLTALKSDGDGNKNILLKKIAADSEVIQTDTIAESVSNPVTSLVGGSSQLFFQYYDNSSGKNHIYKRDYEDISNGSSLPLSSSIPQFKLKIIGGDNIYAEGTEGNIFSFDKSNLSSANFLTVDDTGVTLAFQAQLGDLYVGTRESSRASVLAVSSDLSDSEVVFPTAGDVIEQDACQPKNTADTSVFTRPVWLKRGSLGFVFSGSCLRWDDAQTNSSGLEDAPWPHEDANNQRQRQPQN